MPNKFLQILALRLANFEKESTFTENNLITAGMVTRVSILFSYLFILRKTQIHDHTQVIPVRSGVADYVIFLTTLYDIIYAFSRTT